MQLSLPLAGSARAPAEARRERLAVFVAAAAMVGTLPGRTQGLGLITEPLLADLGLARVTYAELNLWATLIGSAFALAAGRALDALGARTVLGATALGLGTAVCALSRVHGFPALAVAVTLTRGLGQSALSVASIALVARRCRTRVDRAMALYSVLTSVGFMLAFALVGPLVLRHGWRTAWFALGATVVAALAPLAWLLGRDGAERSGDAQPEAGESGLAWSAALATPAFWVFALGAALYGLVASGIGLFNESILAERGFGPEIYHRSLGVTAAAGLAGNFLGGWLAERIALAKLLSTALVVLAAGLAALPWIDSLPGVLAWAVAMGLAGGLLMVLFFSVWPRAFGRRHLGRIQGSAQMVTVVASALGPLLLAWCAELTESYRAVFLALAGAAALLAAAAARVRAPRLDLVEAGGARD
jgi:MFS family permease